jgi:L-ribulose-5-phosphate 3-epimerase
MNSTRRQLLALAAGAGSRALAQVRPANPLRASRTSPAVCLFSQVLIKLAYEDLGGILRGLGVDGCDLSVQPGGHVIPAQSSVDMMRSVESITGVGLDVPIITTAYTSATADPTIRNVMAICGEMGVPVMRTGVWKYSETTDVETRLTEVQRDIMGLFAYGRAVNMSIAIPNTAGENVGSAIWDTNMVIRGTDPRLVGYAFDPGYAAVAGGAGGAAVALRLALPRVKMIAARDFVWAKDSTGTWKATPCPLGEGIVEWPKVFATLARAKFNGPLSIHIDYQPQDELAAIRREVDFVRKQIRAAYGAP